MLIASPNHVVANMNLHVCLHMMRAYIYIYTGNIRVAGLVGWLAGWLVSWLAGSLA